MEEVVVSPVRTLFFTVMFGPVCLYAQLESHQDGLQETSNRKWSSVGHLKGADTGGGKVLGDLQSQ